MLIMTLIVLVVVEAFLISIGSRFQATTLYVGKQIVTQDILHYFSGRGAQDVITPRFQKRAIELTIVGEIAILVVGFLVKWYLGVVALIFTLFLRTICDRLVSRNLSFYTKHILVSLANRQANFVKRGDTSRASAAQQLYDSVEVFHRMAVDQQLIVPSMQEARES